MQARGQTSNSPRGFSRRLRLRSRLLGATVLGLTSLGATWPGCGSLPPCFDDTAIYRVQLLERLPESDCDPSLELDWVFEVTASTLEGENNSTCTYAGFRFRSAPGETSQFVYGRGHPQLSTPVKMVGAVTESISSTLESCNAQISLAPFAPQDAETGDKAALHDQIVWQVHWQPLAPSCPQPDSPYEFCTDYYTSITEKL